MLKIIDLFCGCGGISLGFQQAGFKVLGGIDFNKDAIETYNLNFPSSKGYCLDLTKIDKKEIYNIFPKEIDVIIGGPPCQGFSAANMKKKDNDERNKLFFEFVRFVSTIKPKIFVMENVKGILTMNNGYAKKKIYEIFEKIGYKITHQVLNSVDYGIPQNRQRAFFIGKLNSKFDFNNLNVAPKKITVWDAIGEMYCLEKEKPVNNYYTLKNDALNSYTKYLRNGHNKIFNHDITYPALKVQNRIIWVPQGGNWKNIPDIMFENNRKNRHSSAYKRLNENLPSITIDTGNSHSNYFHPKYDRIPTVREAARIQSFPDNFIFCGTRTSQYRQVGNAVPPLLAKAIAIAIKKEIENEEK